jgi:hypothetical protein
MKLDPPDLDAVRRRLQGAWTLVRWDIDAGDGRTPQQPFGAGATGLIVYTADGWMSAAIARAGRPPLATPSVRQAPPAQQLAAFESYFHYAGPYALRSVDGVVHVVHRVQWSLNPNFVGSEQQRRVDFDGDADLLLSADEPAGAVTRRHRLHWRRP